MNKGKCLGILPLFILELSVRYVFHGARACHVWNVVSKHTKLPNSPACWGASTRKSGNSPVPNYLRIHPIQILRRCHPFHLLKHLTEIKRTLKPQHFCHFINLQIFFRQEPFAFPHLAGVHIFCEACFVIFTEQLA